MTLDENIKKAFDFAQEAVKQVLTLATASIGGAIALLEKKDQPGIHFGTHGSGVEIGLALLMVSIAAGLATLLNLAGNLEKPGGSASPSIYRGSIRSCWIVQLFTFAVGLIIVVVAAL